MFKIDVRGGARYFRLGADQSYDTTQRWHSPRTNLYTDYTCTHPPSFRHLHFMKRC